jgi:hypothetical protein
MGQFLGFSREHSSTVALVRKLHTGHVSPQYHVVFDDKFETVYNDGKSLEEVDRICEELFVSSREHFVEDEYDEDGLLIYRPPPSTRCGFWSRSAETDISFWRSSSVIAQLAKGW